MSITLRKDFQGRPLGGDAMPARVARCFVFWRIFELFAHRERVYEHLARAWRVFWRLALGSLKKLDFPTTEYPTTENQNQKRR